jgi:hypothetical protein
LGKILQKIVRLLLHRYVEDQQAPGILQKKQPEFKHFKLQTFACILTAAFFFHPSHSSYSSKQRFGGFAACFVQKKQCDFPRETHKKAQMKLSKRHSRENVRLSNGKRNILLAFS